MSLGLAGVRRETVTRIPCAHKATSVLSARLDWGLDGRPRRWEPRRQWAGTHMHPYERFAMARKLENDFRSTFERTIGGACTHEELLAAVRVLVRDLKKQGRAPEKVLVTIKRLCGLPRITLAADTDANADNSPTKQVSDMVLRAAIDEYYDRPRSSGPQAASVRTAL